MNLTERLIELALRLGPWLSVTAVALVATLGFQTASNLFEAKADLLRGAAWACFFLSIATFSGHCLTRRD